MPASRRLLNRIAAREVAIVSPHAGTTRDVIEVHLDLEGYPVTLLDTAGIRETDDPIEQEGVRRARARAAAADLVLWVIDAVDRADAADCLIGRLGRCRRPGVGSATRSIRPSGRVAARKSIRPQVTRIHVQNISYFSHDWDGRSRNCWMPSPARPRLFQRWRAGIDRARASPLGAGASRRPPSTGRWPRARGGREDIVAEELRLAAPRARAASPAGSMWRIFWT